MLRRISLLRFVRLKNRVGKTPTESVAPTALPTMDTSVSSRLIWRGNTISVAAIEMVDAPELTAESSSENDETFVPPPAAAAAPVSER
jgi:hypothetical protein